jgi:hypothetical protein
MTKKLGWISVTGFAVGFTAMFLAFATGGSDALEWSQLRALGPNVWSARCQDTPMPEDAPTERRWTWEGRDEISIGLASTVHYRGGEGDEVIIRGAPQILANIVIEDNAIGLKCMNFGRMEPVEITLPGRIFREINLAGSGRITLENVQQPELNLGIAGSGTITAQGKVDRLELNIAGSGDARLADLTMKDLEVNVAGSGDTEAAPTDSAQINMSGSGNMHLLSRPTRIESNIRGSGRIIHAPRNAAGDDRS